MIPICLALSAKSKTGVQAIWITPIRALSKEIKLAAEQLIEAWGLSITVGIRTGDTSTAERHTTKKVSTQYFNYYTRKLACIDGSKGIHQLFRGAKLCGGR